MRAREQLTAELQDLVASHYYREDFELAASARAWHDQLPADDSAQLRAIVLERLTREPTLVELYLVQAMRLAEAAPALVAWLDREQAATPVSRALMAALPAGAGDAAYRAVERFVDSDQEWEALRALGRLDFPRTRSRLLSAARRDSHLDLALHMLHDRRKELGWPAFAAETRAWFTTCPPADRSRLQRVLQAKSDSFHPFPAAERAELLAWLKENPAP